LYIWIVVKFDIIRICHHEFDKIYPSGLTKLCTLISFSWFSIYSIHLLNLHHFIFGQNLECKDISYKIDQLCWYLKIKEDILCSAFFLNWHLIHPFLYCKLLFTLLKNIGRLWLKLDSLRWKSRRERIHPPSKPPPIIYNTLMNNLKVKKLRK
jgi:hypothetical protein